MTPGVIFLIYDITNHESFDKIEDYWLPLLQEKLPSQPFCLSKYIFFLVGNKLDRNEERQVCYERASQYAEEKNMEYFEVTAKRKASIASLFTRATEQVISCPPKQYFRDLTFFTRQMAIPEIMRSDTSTITLEDFCRIITHVHMLHMEMNSFLSSAAKIEFICQKISVLLEFIEATNAGFNPNECIATMKMHYPKVFDKRLEEVISSMDGQIATNSSR